MKKLLLLLIPVVIIGGLAGCKGKGSQKVTLQLFHYKQEIVTGMNEIVQAFSQKYPNITIETETIPNDAQTVLKARLVAGEAPDIMMLQAYSTVFEYAQAGYLLDMTNEKFMENIVDGAKTAVNYEGKLYAMPLDMAAIGVVYNKDIFTKYGIEVPRTYSDLKKATQILQSNGVTPFAVSIKDNWPLGHLFSMAHTASIGDGLIPWIKSMNDGTGSFASADMNMIFDVFDFYKANGGDKAMELDYNAQTSNFASGNYAMMVQGLWAYGSSKSLNPALNAGFFPFPFFDDASKNKLYADTDSTLAVSANAPKANIDAAKKFLEFLTSPEGAAMIVSKARLLPTVKGADVSSMDAPFQDLVKYVGDGVVMPWAFSMWPTVVFETSKSALQEYYSGQRTKDQMITYLDDLWKNK
ncbi:MAG: hypothetical protein A2015_03905 [Spirochaetes bacterium GWF1_31_7]|nr:MAG: hypothetical protein A2Y30_06450 [Spirochaetes bacterium GWE1_32_154]OHD44910.1 MAG: hypothetical protein A2Y29_06665 [Spirochaetes bacterium GWE2_31_10]OHD48853.1 MAG: hypothetical protein A2015_03905 [Spirochaetes bacterium GWF1_31_7]HBI36888.1 hypothetical protein [Spirochaetia bacterium]